MNTRKTTALALLTTLGLGLAAAAVSAQTTAKPATPTTPMMKSTTAPTGTPENETEYLQKLRRYRRDLSAVKSGVDSDKNQAMDENRKAFNHGINEAIDAIDKEIVAHKNDKK